MYGDIGEKNSNIHVYGTMDSKRKIFARVPKFVCRNQGREKCTPIPVFRCLRVFFPCDAKFLFISPIYVISLVYKGIFRNANLQDCGLSL